MKRVLLFVLLLVCGFAALHYALEGDALTTVDANGVETIPTARSLSRLNGSCTLPSTLSGDPYLPQVRAQSIEAGTRGALGVFMLSTLCTSPVLK